MLLSLPGLSITFAQYEEDDAQTDRHAAKDAAYLQRMKDSKKKATEGASTREQFLARANALVRDKNFNSASNDAFLVRTDDPRLRPGELLALLDSFQLFFDSFWAPDRTLQEPSEPTPIFLFYSFNKYNQLLDTDFSRSFVRPAGHFDPGLDMVFVHTDAEGRSELPQVLVHELAHQLSFSKLGWKHGVAPPWVLEGLAGYFGYTYRGSDGAFVAGEIGGKNVAYLKGGETVSAQESKRELQRFKRIARLTTRKGESVLEPLLSLLEPGRFYFGENGANNYTASWLLTHFLLHYQDGLYRPGFLAFLDGEPINAQALLDSLGIPMEQLDREFMTHLGELRARS